MTHKEPLTMRDIAPSSSGVQIIPKYTSRGEKTNDAKQPSSQPDYETTPTAA